MSVREIIAKMIDYWDFKHYTVEYLMICEQAGYDEAIDYLKQYGRDVEELCRISELKYFFKSHYEEIKTELLNYQKGKYGDIKQCSVRVQGM